MTQRQEAASRMAFAAYMHDLGKLAERAKIAVEKDDINTHKQLYCPYQTGRWTHVHTAYTALAIDKLEPYLPMLKGVDFAPFANALSRGADDSLINASAAITAPKLFYNGLLPRLTVSHRVLNVKSLKNTMRQKIKQKRGLIIIKHGNLAYWNKSKC